MPSAVPFQQGLIGQYNNSHGNPGVYVSWDPDTNFPSTQSLIFKGVANNDYRFPLIVSTYTNNSTQTTTQPPTQTPIWTTQHSRFSILCHLFAKHLLSLLISPVFQCHRFAYRNMVST